MGCCVVEVVVGSGVPAAAALLVMLWMTGVAQTIPLATAVFLMKSRLDSSPTVDDPLDPAPLIVRPLRILVNRRFERAQSAQ